MPTTTAVTMSFEISKEQLEKRTGLLISSNFNIFKVSLKNLVSDERLTEVYQVFIQYLAQYDTYARKGGDDFQRDLYLNAKRNYEELASKEGISIMQCLFLAQG